MIEVQAGASYWEDWHRKDNLEYPSDAIASWAIYDLNKQKLSSGVGVLSEDLKAFYIRIPGTVLNLEIGDYILFFKASASSIYWTLTETDLIRIVNPLLE